MNKQNISYLREDYFDNLDILQIYLERYLKKNFQKI